MRRLSLLSVEWLKKRKCSVAMSGSIWKRVVKERLYTVDKLCNSPPVHNFSVTVNLRLPVLLSRLFFSYFILLTLPKTMCTNSQKACSELLKFKRGSTADGYKIFKKS